MMMGITLNNGCRRLRRRKKWRKGGRDSICKQRRIISIL